MVIILALGMVESVTLLAVDADTRVESATLLRPVVLFVVLLLARGEFFAVVPRRNVFVALATLIIGFAITISMGWAMVEALPSSVARSEALGVLGQPGDRRLGSGDHRDLRTDATGSFLLGGLGTVVYVAFGFALFRTRPKDRLPQRSGRGRYPSSLLHDHGDRDSLAYFATRRDSQRSGRHRANQLSPTGWSSGVSLASADPIGDPESWPPAIERGWRRRHFGWAPAVMGASKWAPGLRARAGLEACRWATRRSSSSRSSRWTAATCGRCGRPSTASSATATPPGATSPGHPRRPDGRSDPGCRPLA